MCSCNTRSPRPPECREPGSSPTPRRSTRSSAEPPTSRSVRALALVLQAEMLLRDPPTVLDTGDRAARSRAGAAARRTRLREWTFTLGMLALREDRLTEARDLFASAICADHQPQEAAAYLAVVEARLGRADSGPSMAGTGPRGGPDLALTGGRDRVARSRAIRRRRCGKLQPSIPEEYWLRLALARELTAAGRHDELVEVDPQHRGRPRACPSDSGRWPRSAPPARCCYTRATSASARR